MPNNSSNEISLSENHTVLLPCEPALFREFISGLLGQPQTLKGRIPGPFEVNRQDASNIHALLMQRVLSQNDATLMSFAAQTTYDDQSSVKVNSLNEFSTYQEVRPLGSVALSLIWTFLIKFPAKTVPEKQTVNIAFVTKEYLELDDYDSSVSPQHQGATLFQIEYTDRSWGGDIEALLGGHLKTFVRPESQHRKFVSKHAGQIGVATGAAIALAFGAGLAVATRTISGQYSRELALIDKAPNYMGTSTFHKIEFISKMLSDGTWEKFGMVASIGGIIALFVSVLFGAFIAETLNIRRPSFVLLTQKALESKTETLKKLDRNWIKFLCSVLGAVFLGVAGNFLFYFLTN